MIETVFSRPSVVARLKSGPMGTYLGSLGASLRAQGYKRGSIQRHLRAADAFGRWLSRRGLSPSEADEESVKQYVAEFPRLPCTSKEKGRLPQIAFGLNKLLAILREQGVVPPRPIPSACTEVERWLSSFDEYLDRVRGLSTSRRSTYLRFSRGFLDSCFGTTTTPHWESLTPEDIIEFVQGEASRLKHSAGDAMCAIRALLRFLVIREVISPNLIGAVPSVRTWRLDSLPQYMTSDEVERVLKICDNRTARGVRDQTILTLLSRFGLRAGEVARLSLDDIDWGNGVVLIRAGKTSRERSLPLPQDVGLSLVSYLKEGRPQRSNPTFFLACVAPFGPLSPYTISWIARTRLQEAGIKASRLGAHLLRHTAATHMVRRGATFKEVADVLGHRHLSSTRIYAKLNLDALVQVAMPWPEGQI